MNTEQVTIFITRQVFCRMDQWNEKLKVNQQQCIEMFDQYKQAMAEDFNTEFLWELPESEEATFLQGLCDHTFTCSNDQEKIDMLDKHYKMIVDGKGFFENEESETAFATSCTEAIILLATKGEQVTEW